MSRYGWGMARIVLALAAFLTIVAGVPHGFAAESPLYGIWRGTIAVDNPRAAEPRIDTKAALHLRSDGPSELYVERLGHALAVAEIFRNPSGTVDVYTGSVPVIELRNIKVAKDRFDAGAVYESDAGTVWQGKASFARVKPLSAPSGKPKCANAPASLAALCGAWSGISLRGQPKLLVVEAVTRNKGKAAWELKVKQVWGGESDLASAGMSFPYTTYVTDEELPLVSLGLRTTGKLAYRFEVGATTLVGGSITDAADRTVYTRATR